MFRRKCPAGKVLGPGSHTKERFGAQSDFLFELSHNKHTSIEIFHSTSTTPSAAVISLASSQYSPISHSPSNPITIDMSFTIKTPCSSANIGPGFDAMGIALSLFLELRVTVNKTQEKSEKPLNCVITYEDQSGSAEQISLDPEVNLITRVALYVLKCHDQLAFPVETHIHIVNPIPLSRGLGSSGTAVVAGVMLGNEIGGLGLSKARLLDYCLMIGLFLFTTFPILITNQTIHVERHPDNVAATLFGGFVGTYLNDLNPEDAARKEVPLSEVLPSPAGGVDTGLKPPSPPLNIGHYRKFPWAKEIKAIAIIPDFVVPTAKAREVLPKTYSRADVVCN